MTADPRVTAAVGTGGSIYSWLQLPWAEWAAVLTVLYLVIQIVGALPKAIEAIKGLLNK
ncbi:hypothetical protein HOR55_gp09 [Ralstonia phage RS-PII-1]|uniref:Uncharacterized protein n=1 Tax=Ralstonia phage RS-PII-1 TaxID=1932892 RepID=A0A1L7DQC5_9CAUD|nr:hypothetical protein HOR55_gp09 [Ralstonia phage RS-PII-1]APU00296.1 hypothetical protein [Ralstonia phage RS-PII-1]